MRKQTLAKIQELRQEVDQEWAKERRREYLKGEFTSKLMETWGDIAKYEHFKMYNSTEMYLIYGSYIQLDIKKLLQIKGEFVAMNTNKQSDITPDMIARAKEFPFEELWVFKRNMALCPFHPDKDASMKLYPSNTVYCFSCDKSWDTIEFVKELHGITFPEAIRRLQ